MARVARVLLSVLASSAVLERDFCTAGRLIMGSRSSLSAAYAEMVMFLNKNIEHIPMEVLALSAMQALKAVARRPSTRRRRLPPFLRARRRLRAKRAWTPATMSTQGRRSLRAKRALTPAAATPQGKAQTRSLEDEMRGSGKTSVLSSCVCLFVSFKFFFGRCR